MMKPAPGEPLKLAGVRRQLTDAQTALTESRDHAAAGRYDPAYRAALRGRNQIFHATRGLLIARGEEPPDLPIVGGATPGILADLDPTLTAIATALTSEDDLATIPPLLTSPTLRDSLARYLAWLRSEIARLMSPP